MRFDEFEKLVASEPPRTVVVTVAVRDPEVLERAKKSGGMLMTDFLSSKPVRTEQREVRDEHVLGPPASREAIEGWQRRYPQLVLPPDLLELVARANGIHLWAYDGGRAYQGLAPIEEWDLARNKIYGADELLGDRFVAISYDQDNTLYVVIDVTSGRYYLMDTVGPDESSPIGSSASDLLDYLWKTRIEPKR